MAKIYFINAQGKKVMVEVSEEIAKQYRESLREEWRNDAYEKYYSKSLEGIIEAGRDFEDDKTDTEEVFDLQEKKRERAALIDKLNAALPYLTDLQRQTIHKLFVLNMSQAEIAKEEGVLRCTIKERVDGIFVKLKKLIEKNKNIFRKTPQKTTDFSLISEGTFIFPRRGGLNGVHKCDYRGNRDVCAYQR